MTDFWLPPLPPVWPVPHGFRLSRLLMSEPSTLKAEEDLFRSQLFEAEPELFVAVAWARRLNALLRRKETGDLRVPGASPSDSETRVQTSRSRLKNIPNRNIWTLSPTLGVEHDRHRHGRS